jgi:hypothetical protein
VKIVWSVLWCTALVATLWAKNYESQRDIDLILTWLMIVVTFPSSLLGILIVSGISYMWHEFFHFAAYAGGIGIIITWLIFFSLGWLQWFVLVPRIFRKIRTGKRGG